MSNIFKSLKSDYNKFTNKFNNKNQFTQVLHIPNDKSYIVINITKVTILGIQTITKCSCINCVINKNN